MNEAKRTSRLLDLSRRGILYDDPGMSFKERVLAMLAGFRKRHGSWQQGRRFNRFYRKVKRGGTV
jgi:hypothetical protein